MQQDYTKIDEEQLKFLLDQAFSAIQGSLENCSQSELKTLMLIVHNTKFFQRVLGPQINLYDFLERIKHRLGYKMYPSGTIITPEGGSVTKLSIVVKGKALRFRPRAEAELEKEVMENYLGADPTEDEESKEDMAKLKQFLQKAKTFTEIPAIMKRFDRCTQYISNLLPSGEIDRGERQLRKNQTIFLSSETITSEKQNSPSSESNQLEGKPAFRKQRSTKSFTMLQLAGVRAESPLKRGEEIKIQKEQQEKRNKEIALEAFISELDREKEEDEIEENRTESDEGSPKRLQMRKLRKNKELEKDLALFAQILKKNPKQEPIFYMGGGQILRNQRVKEYVAGGYFGEHFLKSNKPKESLLIASEDLYVLTIEKEDVSELVTQLGDEAVEKANFFLSLFPAAHEEDVKSLSFHFREETFLKDEKIYLEGELTGNIYILKSGSVGLVKKVENSMKEKQSGEALLLNANRTQKIEVPLAEIVEGQFFGDEILLDERKRKTTAICKAVTTKVFCLELDAFHLIKEDFLKLFKLLRNHAKERSGWRQERMENMIERALASMKQSSQLDYTDSSPKTNNNDSKNFSRVKITPIATKGLYGVGNPESKDAASVGAEYDKETNTPGSSKKKASPRKQIAATSKNMDIYKERFSRKAYTEKPSPSSGPMVESPRKSIIILKSKGTKAEIEKDVIIPVNNRHSKKTLSVVTTSSANLPRIDTKFNLDSPVKESKGMITPKAGYKDFSPVSPHRLPYDIQSARVSYSNILQTLSPENAERTIDGVIKNNDGSLTVVAGRSRLRSILNNFDKPVQVIEEAYYSPQMNSSSLSPRKMNPKIAPKLKQIKKITSSVGGDIFKSPRSKYTDQDHSKMLKALMITKAKI